MAIQGDVFLRRDGVVAAQIVEHVIHIHGLVNRPGHAGLVVSEIRVRKVQLHLRPGAAVASWQAQRVPEVRPEKRVHRFFGNVEHRALRQLIVPKLHRRRAARRIVEREQLDPPGGRKCRRREFDDEFARVVRRQGHGKLDAVHACLCVFRDVRSGERHFADLWRQPCAFDGQECPLGAVLQGHTRGLSPGRHAALLGGQVALVNDADRHRAPRSAEFGQPHLLQENHLDVATPLRGRTVERIGELLDLAAHAVFFKSRGDNGQPIRQPLSLPGSGKILPRVAEIEGDKKAFPWHGFLTRV